MLKNFTPYIYIVAFILFIAACAEEENPKFDKDNFTSIFDSNGFDSAYYPIDIKQTVDEGYLVLAKRKLEGEFAGVYILKANKFGNFESQINVDPQLVNPIGTLMPLGENFYFFCMDVASKEARLVSINQSGSIVGTVNVTYTYPCASAPSKDNKFVLLSYNNGDKRTVISTIDPATGAGPNSSFRLGVGGEDKIEEDILKHFFQYGRKFPFFVGQLSGDTYYFNGFYDYTLSLVFTRMGASDQFTGIIQGQHEDGGFSAALPLSGNRFAASVFNFGDNYILPNKTLETTSNAPGGITGLGGFTLPELVSNANVRNTQATVKEKSVIIFAGDTKAKQIGLWFYDEASNSLMSSRYFGFSNPFEIGNVSTTLDGGLVICGTTYMAGRFPRICIFKISKQEFENQVK
ncbi:hypothetical protein [Chryseosolibacter indicus]|uniref:DUF4374 domain-containing protein n=1 Tax=Chryseosolibacter indicus TaxID=2782351 RepID=A0ABS5VUU9_9BACT|nr:hypothetical protein [Chryseosolibacter indicus]MBT1705205.1 hypothetical protein [Chryseosolibacter indicus]